MIREFLGRIDVLIDLHAGGAMPTVDYTYVFDDEALSRAFGTKLLYRPTGGAGTGTGVVDQAPRASAMIIRKRSTSAFTRSRAGPQRQRRRLHYAYTRTRLSQLRPRWCRIVLAEQAVLVAGGGFEPPTFRYEPDDALCPRETTSATWLCRRFGSACTFDVLAAHGA